MKGTTGLVALLFPLACGFCAPPLGAQVQPEEILPGFKANQAYATAGVDNVNTFSGDPGVVLPIGPEYKLGPGTSFQMSAAYSNKFWAWDSDCGFLPPPNESVPAYFTMAMGGPLGLGWAWPLGYVDGGFYHSPDGGRHEFKQTPNETNLVTVDGSNLRLSGGPGSYTVEFPDGTRRVYSTAFTPTRAGTSPDLYWTWHYGETPATRYLLTQIRDGHNPPHVLLQVDDQHGGEPAWIRLFNKDGSYREIRLYWTTFTTASGLQWRVLDYGTFPTAASTLEVRFAYRSLRMNRLHNGGSAECPALSPTAEVPVLASITASDSAEPSFPAAYLLDYYEGGTFVDGSVQRITLPTGGRITYEYGETAEWPAASSSSPTFWPPDWERFRDMTEGSPAVIVRTETDPTATPDALSVTRWQRKHFGGPNQGFHRRVTMIAPGFAKESYFSVEQSQAPANPSYSGGLELVSRTFAASAFEPLPPVVWEPDESAHRTVVNCYQGEDDANVTSTACNAHDVNGYPTPVLFKRNVRKLSSANWHGDLHTEPGDWMLGHSDCGSFATATMPCAQTVSSDYWAPAHDFKTVVTSANTNFLLYGLIRRKTTNWTRIDGGPWFLGAYNSRTTEDLPGADGTEGRRPPYTSQSTFSFDVSGAAGTTLGFLQSASTSDPGYGLISRTFTDDGYGNPGTETVSATPYGGTPVPYFLTASPPIMTDRSFEKGALLKVERYKPDGTKYHATFDVTRDVNGPITSSRDPNGLQTSYSYDAFGRLTSITPPTGTSTDRTTYCYRPYDGGLERGAYVLAKEGATNTCSSADSSGTGKFEAYLYDGLGRLVREVQRQPRYATSTELAYRTTAYDAAGNRTFLSKWQWCGTSDALVCFGAPASPTGTTWSLFDPFGRAQTVTKPDGTQVTISYSDTYALATGNYTVPFSDTTETTTTPGVAGGSSTVFKRKDILGRTLMASFPYQGALTDGMLYKYNVLDKLAYASVYSDENGARQQDARVFQYDRLGFLRSEQHPEKGMTTYLQYDALGNSTWRRDEAPGRYFKSTFDRLGRLETLSAGPGTVPQYTYVQNTYDTAPSGLTSDAPKGRLSSRMGYNYDQADNPAGTVTEKFGYGGSRAPAGQLATREVSGLSWGGDTPTKFTDSWTYDSLGYLFKYSHPKFVTAGPWEEYTYRSGKVTGSSVLFMKGTPGDPIVSSATYHPNGSIASYTTGNGATTSIEIDSMGRPQRIRTALTPFDTGTYSYDGLGNVTAMGGDSFEYDARSRLTRAVFSPQEERFGYEDKYGNLTKRSTDGGGSWWEPGIDLSTNRLSGASGYQYDLSGNLTQEGGRTHTYDLLSREIQSTESTTERYYYDGAGERVQRVVGTQTAITLRDRQNRVVTEFTPVSTSYSRTRDVFYFGNLQVASVDLSQRPNTEWLFYASDHLGTPRLEMSPLYGTTKSFKFWSYGELLTGSAVPGRFGLAAMETSTGVGDYYDHARNYRGSLRRFNSPDKLSGKPEDPQSWNRYTYARNNPLNVVDPDGKQPTWSQDVASAVISAGSSVQSFGASLNGGGVVGTATDAAVGTVGSMVQGFGDMFNLGTSTGEAFGSGADLSDTASAVAVDVGRLSGFVLTMAGAAQNAGAASTTIGRTAVTTVDGTATVPGGYVRSVADNGQGVVFRPAGSSGNAGAIRVAGPNAQNPGGYARVYNGQGQPTNLATGKPGPNAVTHPGLTGTNTITPVKVAPVPAPCRVETVGCK